MLSLLSQVDAALPPQHDMLDVEESGGSLEGSGQEEEVAATSVSGSQEPKLGSRLALRTVAALNESTKS